MTTEDKLAQALRTHELKTWTNYFGDLLSGAKTFEVRYNDRDFRRGDILRLREWSIHRSDYTGRELTRRVSYVLTASEFCKAGYAILALAEYDSAQASKASGALTDAGPWTLTEGGSIQSADFKHDVVLSIGGDFASKAERLAYAKGLCAQINAGCALAHPTERQGQKPEAVTEQLVLHCQVDSLRDALVKVLDTREKEAKAWFSAQNAKENFSDRGVKEDRAHLVAMTAASDAEKGARLLLATLTKLQKPSPPQAAPDRVGGGDV